MLEANKFVLQLAFQFDCSKVNLLDFILSRNGSNRYSLKLLVLPEIYEEQFGFKIIL